MERWFCVGNMCLRSENSYQGKFLNTELAWNTSRLFEADRVSGPLYFLD